MRLHHPSGHQWAKWRQFAHSTGQHPFLINRQGPAFRLERSQHFLAFARSLRAGEHDGGRPARGAAIEATLRVCGRCISGTGLADPRRDYPGQTGLNPEFTALYRQYKAADPPPRAQHALPATTVRWIATTFRHNPSPLLRTVADLVTLAFFFLLRVGEYTPSSGPRLTVPLRNKDFKLWRDGTRLPNDAPLSVLLSADAVTICLENQKNGHKNAVIHHTSSADPSFDPVRAAARRVFVTARSGPDTPIGAVAVNGLVTQVSAQDIRDAVLTGAIGDNLVASGYDLTRLGSHSIRAGGAVQLKILGYDSDIIKKLGRWSGATYLRYIQTQIGQVTSGIAALMARPIRFTHVGS